TRSGWACWWGRRHGPSRWGGAWWSRALRGAPASCWSAPASTGSSRWRTARPRPPSASAGPRGPAVDDDDDLDAGPPEAPLPKPDELLALHGVTEALFTTLQRWFAVPDEVSLDLSDVDAAVREMGDPVMVAALAMRKLQAL